MALSDETLAGRGGVGGETAEVNIITCCDFRYDVATEMGWNVLRTGAVRRRAGWRHAHRRAPLSFRRSAHRGFEIQRPLQRSASHVPQILHGLTMYGARKPRLWTTTTTRAIETRRKQHFRPSISGWFSWRQNGFSRTSNTARVVAQARARTTRPRARERKWRPYDDRSPFK